MTVPRTSLLLVLLTVIVGAWAFLRQPHSVTTIARPVDPLFELYLDLSVLSPELRRSVAALFPEAAHLLNRPEPLHLIVDAHRPGAIKLTRWSGEVQELSVKEPLPPARHPTTWPSEHTGPLYLFADADRLPLVRAALPPELAPLAALLPSKSVALSEQTLCVERAAVTEFSGAPLDLSHAALLSIPLSLTSQLGDFFSALHVVTEQDPAFFTPAEQSALHATLEAAQELLRKRGLSTVYLTILSGAGEPVPRPAILLPVGPGGNGSQLAEELVALAPNLFTSQTGDGAWMFVHPHAALFPISLYANQSGVLLGLKTTPADLALLSRRRADGATIFLADLRTLVAPLRLALPMALQERPEILGDAQQLIHLLAKRYELAFGQRDDRGCATVGFSVS